jgi:Arc/MetJ-type ribon-helix-helix transcriptional regulator
LRHTDIMATTKVTITLDDEVLTRVRAAVESGQAANVSAYISEAASQRVAREARAEEIERRWGPFSPKAMAWARRAAGVEAEPGDAAYLAEIDAERSARRPAASA